MTAARQWPEHLGAGKPYPADVDERLEDWLSATCLERQGKTVEARQLLTRLAAAVPTKPGMGRLLEALALASLSRQAEAQQALDAWAAHQPDARVAEWGRHVFAGERPAWPDGAAANEEGRVLAEWLK